MANAKNFEKILKIVGPLTMSDNLEKNVLQSSSPFSLPSLGKGLSFLIKKRVDR